MQTVLGSLFSGRTQGKQLATIAGVVLLRTLLQDRIATLNGRTVEHVLRQVGSGSVLLQHDVAPNACMSTAAQACLAVAGPSHLVPCTVVAPTLCHLSLTTARVVHHQIMDQCNLARRDLIGISRFA